MADKTNADRLQELLTFDAAKKQNLTQELMSEVVKEITEERVKEAKSRAKEQLVKAMQLREQMAKAKRDFDNQHQKMEKELGKIMNQIQGILTGRCPEENKEECCKEEA